MKQDLPAIKTTLKAIYSQIIELQIATDLLRSFGAPVFADRLQICLDQIERFQQEALKALGEEIE